MSAAASSLRAQVSAALDALAPAGGLGLALSGGGDSMALLHLAADWAQARGRPFRAATVDHGLRPESGREAAFAAEAAAARGIAHATLRSSGPVPRGNLEAAAREARYRLLRDWVAGEGLAALALGHTRDDQVETFLMRLARGSGVDGLAAMAPLARRGGLVMIRPLLGIARSALRADLNDRGQGWIEDPMNADPRFLRARLRAARAVLSAAGLSDERLAATVTRLARARRALEAATDSLMAEAASLSPAGYARLSLAPWRAAPEEVALRALARLLMAVSGAPYPPRHERLERLAQALRLPVAEFPGRTLLGCRLLRAPGGTDAVLVVREAAALPCRPMSLAPGRAVLWDGRFRVTVGGGAEAPEDAEIRPLDAEGRAALKALGAADRLAVLPGAARPAIPLLWRGGRLLAAPVLGLLPPACGFPGIAADTRFHGLA